MSKADSFSGNRVILESYGAYYNQCILEKGWRPLSKDASRPGPGATPFAVIGKSHFESLGYRFDIPESFNLERNEVSRYGSIDVQNLFYKSGNTYINVILQKSETKSFQDVEYEIAQNFFLYDRGHYEKNSDNLRWTSFVGRVDQEWVAGLGAYLFISRQQRVAVVITQSLGRQKELPPDGLVLPEAQKVKMDAFESRWRNWLQSIRKQ